MTELTRSIKRAYGYSPRDIQKGARPSLNGFRAERLARQIRFSRGAKPAGTREPEIITLGPIRLAYKRTFRPLTGGDPYRDLLELFEWAAAQGIPLFRPWGPIGICYDDFDLDPIAHFIYDCCVALPPGFERPLAPGMGVHLQGAGTYARLRFAGDLEGEEDAIDYFYSGWLPRSGYRLDRRAGLEIFRTESGLVDWNRLELDLLFAITRK